MPGMNENHKRRILSSLEHMDKLLEDSLMAMAPASRSLFSRFTPDVSPAQAHWIESYVEKIREQMPRLLARFELQPGQKTTLASGALRTNLIYLDIALEELYPERMRGYGKMGPQAAKDLTWTLNEIRRLVSLLTAFASDIREVPGIRSLGVHDQALPEGLLGRLAEIIKGHGMVEFHPALESIIRKLESHRLEIAVFGRVSSGKSSLINRLLGIQALPVGTTPMTAVPIRILAGAALKLRVSFAERVETLPIERLPEFATERGNPANSKRVVAIEVDAPSPRLQAGVAFVDTPGIASLATTGSQLAYAYLPESDLGLVLVDGHSSVGREDLDLLRSLHSSGIPAIVIISKCDLLAPPDIEKVVAYTRGAISEHLGLTPEVVAISSVESWAADVDAWFQKVIEPILQSSRAAVNASVRRKVDSLRHSLLASLELRASRGAGSHCCQDAEATLRPLDDGLEELKRKWRGCFDGVSRWTGEILDEAAAQLETAGQNAGETAGDSGIRLGDAVLRKVASYCHAFVLEYEAFAERIRRELGTLQRNAATGLALESFELPEISALPMPVVASLQGIRARQPGLAGRLSRNSRLRHFRREIEERAVPQITQVLEELKPRLRHWLAATLKNLEESYRLQTDPLRYAGTARNSAYPAGGLQDDIQFLRGSRDR